MVSTPAGGAPCDMALYRPVAIIIITVWSLAGASGSAETAHPTDRAPQTARHLCSVRLLLRLPLRVLLYVLPRRC